MKKLLIGSVLFALGTSAFALETLKGVDRQGRECSLTVLSKTNKTMRVQVTGEWDEDYIKMAGKYAGSSLDEIQTVKYKDNNATFEWDYEFTFLHTRKEKSLTVYLNNYTERKITGFSYSKGISHYWGQNESHVLTFCDFYPEN